MLIVKQTLLQERNAPAFAEGATTPETLRQKDCNNAFTLERSVQSLTEGEGSTFITKVVIEALRYI